MINLGLILHNWRAKFNNAGKPKSTYYFHSIPYDLWIIPNPKLLNNIQGEDFV